MRLMAVRRSVIALPVVFSEAEFEMRIKRAAKAGSDPTTLTTFSSVEFGSERMRRTRTTTSGKDGKSTRPADNSAASERTNPKATSLADCGWVLLKLGLAGVMLHPTK